MIKRYSTEALRDIWSDQNKFNVWLQTELAVLEEMAGFNLVPQEDVIECKKKAQFSLEEIERIEKETKHDVIAFITCVANSVGKAGRHIHKGMTSSDLVDTSFAVLLLQSIDVIEQSLRRVIDAVWSRANEYKYTLCIGRSHGIFAEPMTFGLKLLNWFAELKRNQQRLKWAKEQISYGKLSGAVGNYSNLTPQLEEKVLEKLKLKPEPVATQVVPRDRHGFFFTVLAILASSIERFSVEIRHLQRSEVAEVYEPFSKSQKGSSAMPHKKNPILCENLTGLARLVRSYSLAAMENIALWHERDISHSSVERVIAPDATTLIDFMLNRFCNIVKGMVVQEKQMASNLELSKGLIFSGRILVELINNGMTREDAYKIVQRYALQCVDNKELSFKELIKQDQTILNILGDQKIEQIFSYDRYLKYVDFIFNRVEQGAF